MSLVAKYSTSNIEKILNDVERYSIGMDDWFRRFGTLQHSDTNYPPYNTIKESETEFRLEVALAGFRKNEITVYTENNKLFIEGHKETDSGKEYVHHGLANRAFTRAWTISDDIEVKKVTFEDGLLIINLSKIVPEHQKKRVWF